MIENQAPEPKLAIKMPEKEKLVIWVTGGKGGTGKSTLARGVLDILISAGVNVTALDGDQENPQLFRYYHNVGKGVIRTELAERDGGDEILEAMAKDQPDVILVDVAAGGSQILMRLQDESLFLSDAEELGYAFTVVSVISPIMDSVNMLREAMATTDGYSVQHVAVKNLHLTTGNSTFELFEASKTKLRFEQAGGTVIEMRSLLGSTYGAIDKQSLPFCVVANGESDLPRGDFNRTRQWLTCLRDQMALAKGALWL